ncbi:MAG: alcohol dehydrogenase catalytic domain-containing protein [Granulosicoccus sp.]|nr:alcohol dehydrogenase catalytic domain-containing protein [Granulosicoccus sp.]
MKALVYTATQSLEYRDEPMGQPGPDESLVKVHAAGICGSDMHAWHGHDARRIPPLILGHELAGIVQEGSNRGERVAINPLISCGACRHCLAAMPNLCASRDLIGLGQAGGFAEYVSVPTANLLLLPATMSYVEASLTEPTAVSLHAIHLAERIMHRSVSECCALVIGGGAIGALAALILQQKGVRELHIAETSEQRRNTVATLCHATIYDPKGEKVPQNGYFDLVIDAVGSGLTRAASSRLTRPGGVISHIGLQDNKEGLDTRHLTLQEISFIGNYTYNQTDFQAALNLLSSGALGSLEWIETRPLSEGASAFMDIDKANTAAPKIVLIP